MLVPISIAALGVLPVIGVDGFYRTRPRVSPAVAAARPPAWRPTLPPAVMSARTTGRPGDSGSAAREAGREAQQDGADVARPQRRQEPVHRRPSPRLSMRSVRTSSTRPTALRRALAIATTPRPRTPPTRACPLLLLDHQADAIGPLRGRSLADEIVRRGRRLVPGRRASARRSRHRGASAFRGVVPGRRRLRQACLRRGAAAGTLRSEFRVDLPARKIYASPHGLRAAPQCNASHAAVGGKIWPSFRLRFGWHPRRHPSLASRPWQHRGTNQRGRSPGCGAPGGDARELYLAAAGRARAEGDAALKLRALESLGRLLNIDNEYPEAKELLERALAIADAAGRCGGRTNADLARQPRGRPQRFRDGPSVRPAAAGAGAEKTEAIHPSWPPRCSTSPCSMPPRSPSARPVAGASDRHRPPNRRQGPRGANVAFARRPPFHRRGEFASAMEDLQQAMDALRGDRR